MTSTPGLVVTYSYTYRSEASGLQSVIPQRVKNPSRKPWIQMLIRINGNKSNYFLRNLADPFLMI